MLCRCNFEATGDPMARSAPFVKCVGVFWALSALACGAVAGPLPRGALDPNTSAWFYNRPGVTREELSADRALCELFGGQMAGAPAVDPNQVVTQALSRYFYGVGGAPAARSYSDDCLIALGYRRYRAMDSGLSAFELRYSSMDAASQLALISSIQPAEGDLERKWENTFWQPDSEAVERPYVIHARMNDSVQNINWIRSVEPEAAIAPGADDAIVVVTIKREGSIPQGGSNVSFVGYDRRTGDRARVPMGRRGHLSWPGIFAGIARSTPSATFAFVIPAGFYGLNSSGSGTTSVYFCMGTIGFEAQAGSVLDLGTITIRQGPSTVSRYSPPTQISLNIDQSYPEMRSTALAATPDFTARLRPAVYSNGLRTSCIQGLPSDGIVMPGAEWLPNFSPNTGVATPEH